MHISYNICRKIWQRFSYELRLVSVWLSEKVLHCVTLFVNFFFLSQAISRRATLFEMIRDYGQAASDMQRYVYIQTKQMEEKTSGIQDRYTSLANDIRQARIRLSELEEKSRKENSLDMYLVL